MVSRVSSISACHPAHLVASRCDHEPAFNPKRTPFRSRPRLAHLRLPRQQSDSSTVHPRQPLQHTAGVSLDSAHRPTFARAALRGSRCISRCGFAGHRVRFMAADAGDFARAARRSGGHGVFADGRTAGRLLRGCRNHRVHPIDRRGCRFIRQPDSVDDRPLVDGCAPRPPARRRCHR